MKMSLRNIARDEIDRLDKELVEVPHCHMESHDLLVGTLACAKKPLNAGTRCHHTPIYLRDVRSYW